MVSSKEVDSLARLMMAEWERVEEKKVNPSYVATFADMARAVLEEYVTREELDNAVSIANSMDHFADVAVKVEQRNNELAELLRIKNEEYEEACTELMEYSAKAEEQYDRAENLERELNKLREEMSKGA